jgi:hypothetical protein
MNKKTIRTSAASKLATSILAGIDKLPATMTGFTILGTTYTRAELKAKVQSFKTPFDDADQAKAAAAAAEEAVQIIAAEANEFMAATKAALKAGLGRRSVALETVGVTPDKTPAPLSPEKEVAKVAKAKATRAARHTMGSKQRKAIKGQAPTPAPAK